MENASVASALAYLDIEALDFLVQRRERDVELFCGVGLIAVAALKFFDNDAAFNVFEDIEERGARIVFEQRILEAASGDVAGQEA